MRRIKIYGERNSGTHFLKHLVQLYFRNELIEIKYSRAEVLLLKSIKYDFVQDQLIRKNNSKHFGWKHGAPLVNKLRNVKDPPIVLTITKNPYSFLLSLFKKPYHHKGPKPNDFSTFIRSPWICRNRDNLGRQKLKNPIELWNKKNQHYSQLLNHKSLIVFNLKYEQLLEKPESIRTLLSNCSDIKLKLNSHFQQDEIVKKGELPFSFYSDYYMAEKWKSKLSFDDIDYINKHLDFDLINFYKYRILP